MDISNDWEDLRCLCHYAEALTSPLGGTDVELNGMAWSLKPFKSHSFRIDSYFALLALMLPRLSYGITDPHD